MFSTFSLSQPAAEPRAEAKRQRNRYSRLICLGCRERRIRCELPKDVAVPRSGELHEVQTPCYRCRRLDLRCVVRQTILGRPSTQSSTVVAAHVQRAAICNVEPRIRTGSLPQAVSQYAVFIVDDSNDSQIDVVVPNDPLLDGDTRHWNNGILLREPRSPEMIFIMCAIDTIRQENVEQEWFRHLPACYGHAPVLNLPIKAQVQVCAYARGLAGTTSTGCYHALSLAFGALQASIEREHEQPHDLVLATMALLATFEGTMKRSGIPTRLHIDGLAAVIAARPATQPVTELERDILDWYIAESCVMACFQGTTSPFGNISRAYFTHQGLGWGDSDRAQLMALGNELYIHIPRLVILMRTLRLQPTPQHGLLVDLYRLLQSLLELRDSRAERRFMEHATFRPSNDLATPLSQSLSFASVKDYEALACYWQSRLSLLRIERHLHGLLASCAARKVDTNLQTLSLPRSFAPQTSEILLIAKRLLMSADYAATLPLFRQKHLLAYAMVAVWGVTRDGSLQQDGESMNCLMELLLLRVNRALNMDPRLVAEDMDEAAGIFVGGERKGRFAKLYGL
ncbi:hypothetical protein ACHAP5_011971 [Fusarium lateritium]